jgi:hypothetical protein
MYELHLFTAFYRMHSCMRAHIYLEFTQYLLHVDTTSGAMAFAT